MPYSRRKGYNTLKDWDFTIKIKDNDKIIYEKKT